MEQQENNKHCVLVSRYKHGERVALSFNGTKLLNCEIESVSFTESKVRYDVLVPISQDELTIIRDVDSHCVVENLL